MSDENETDRSFLSRWSQRKREAKLPDVDDAAAQADQEAKASPAIAESDTEEEFDLSTLPTLEDLTETTDITGFLRKGVPESVKNAALRKSWALDPAIRNYVNPALDYAYDWNTPGGVPGNSELAAGTDIAKMVLQIMGSGSPNAAAPQDAQAIPTLHHNDAPVPPDSRSEIVALQHITPKLADESVRLSEGAEAPTLLSEDSAPAVTVLNESTSDSSLFEPSAMQQPLRRHGSAKPRV